LGRAAAAAGCELYLVGGVLRDLLLGRVTEDVDIVVAGPIRDLVKEISGDPRLAVRSHDRFQTATVIYPDGRRIDLAMCRREEYPSPGALPKVRPGTLPEDLFRRDFTINALALSLRPGSWGELIDLYGGMRDLKSGVVRVLHGLSFFDDPTRIMRAARFEQRLGFHLDRSTLRLIKNALARNLERNVKPVRYYHELVKIFQEPRAVEILKRLSGLAGPRFFGKRGPVAWGRLSSLQRRREEIQREGVDMAGLMLIALMENEALEHIKDQVRLWQCGRRPARAFLLAPEIPRLRARLTKRRLQPGRIYRILHPLPEAVIHYLRYAARSRVQSGRAALYLDRLRFMETGLDSRDLIDLGVSKGPRLGAMKLDLLAAKMDGHLKNKQSEKKFVLKRVAEA
jgi:tRNA nucleotidyltransferase (CCA-adding enzyme)